MVTCQHIHSLIVFPPQEVCSRAGALSTIRIRKEAFKHRSFNTEKLLHTDAFAQKPLHKGAFTHRRDNFYTEELLCTEAFTQRSRCTQELLQANAFSRRSNCTEWLLHTELLHTNAFLHRSFYNFIINHHTLFSHYGAASTTSFIIHRLFIMINYL